MATGQHKIRIYDLAKELKLDNKKVMEDARREGIDVSVPSNTVPHEVAERIRLKYFPKKVVPQVGPRLVKHVKQAEPAAADAVQVEPIVEPEAAVEEQAPVEPAAVEPPRPKVRILKATPPPAQPIPVAAPPTAEEPEPQEPEPSQATETPLPVPPGIPSVQRPSSQV